MAAGAGRCGSIRRRGGRREGIVEALKARNPLYRLLLRYFLWMSRFTGDEQWQFIGGVYALRMALRTAARAFPPLWIVVWPLNALYRAFVILTWIARPLFALVVCFDRLGRLALTGHPVGIGLAIVLALVFAFGWMVYLWIANFVLLLGWSS